MRWNLISPLLPGKAYACIICPRLIDWDSVAAHEEFMNTSNYPEFIETIKAILASPAGLSIYHTYLQPFPPTKLFEAGNIELAAMTKRPDVSREEFEAIRDKFLDTISKAPGYESHFCGVQHEDDNVYIEMIGWNSVEVGSPWPHFLIASTNENTWPST